MLIAIDYDDTYTTDPPLWEVFATSARGNGHSVIICTGRAFPPNAATSMPIYCTGGEAKGEYLAGFGLRPDVWIDDDPASVTTSLNP